MQFISIWIWLFNKGAFTISWMILFELIGDFKINKYYNKSYDIKISYSSKNRENILFACSWRLNYSKHNWNSLYSDLFLILQGSLLYYTHLGTIYCSFSTTFFFFLENLMDTTRMRGLMDNFAIKSKQASLLWLEGFREACCLHRVFTYCLRYCKTSAESLFTLILKFFSIMLFSPTFDSLSLSFFSFFCVFFFSFSSINIAGQENLLFARDSVSFWMASFSWEGSSRSCNLFYLYLCWTSFSYLDWASLYCNIAPCFLHRLV